jgi:tRNA 2-thiouridine synthesizing protein A
MEKLDMIEVDAKGLVCPMPLLKAKRALNTMVTGQRLRVLATDQASVRDFRVFAEQSGHLLLEADLVAGVYQYLLEKTD